MIRLAFAAGRTSRPDPSGRGAFLFLCLWAVLLGLPLSASAQGRGDGQQEETSAEESSEEQTRFRFVTLAEGVADLRAFDPDLAARALPEISPDAGNTAEGAIEATRRLFTEHGFDEVEKMAKTGGIDATTSNIVAEGRRRMIAEAMKVVTAQYEGRLIVGALDSGNKNSGIASDIDQTIFAMTPDGRPADVNPSEIIQRFDEAFRQLYPGLDPARLGIESMNGADFYPDWRAQHHTSVDAFREEARRVVREKRLNPEAYRSEGELKIQAEGRGYDALREYFEEMKTLDDRLAERRAASSNPDADPEVQRIVAQIQDLQRLAPWSQFEMRVGEDGNRQAVEVRDADPRNQIMQHEPELVRRFAFDGAYDNWIMFQAHPANQPKYLLRSVADGIGLQTSLRFSGEGAGRYDLDRPWVAKPVEYEKIYADPSLGAEEARRQFLRDVYGGLDGRPGSLTLDKVERAMNVAAKARLRHKGTGGFATLTEMDIYREYLPQGERFADFSDEQRLDWAKRAWGVDAREIMLENLMRTVRSPGDITQGWGDPNEWRAIRERFPAADHPHITRTRLKAAAWLQLYHGFVDLMTDDHARQILQGLEEGRRPLAGITGEPDGRPRDMVDRLVGELNRVQGPEAEEARTELEKVLIDAAITRQKLDPALGEPRLAAAVQDVIRQEARQRILATQTNIQEMRQQYERVRQKLIAGEYTSEVVADRVIEGTALQLARATQSVLSSLGFQGEVRVSRTINYLADVEQRGVPEIEVRLADQSWNARQALSNFASTGNLDSFTQIILAYQERGAEEAVRITLRELAMNVPGVSQSKAAWDGAITGNWQGLWMVGTGAMIPIAGQGYVLVSIATSSVKIVGNMVLEPLYDDDRDMAYQGFLGAENDFVRDQRGQRVSVLHRVPITVIPHEVEGPEGRTVTQYEFAEYPEEEVRRVLIERMAAGIDLEGIPVDTAYAFGREHGLLGGGPEWDRLLARATDPLNEPRLNFEAKRASLWHHYREEVDAWLASRWDVDTEVLVNTEIRSQATEKLRPFFQAIVADWAYGRGDFEGFGENQLMVPWDAQQRTQFFQRIATRMAGDYIRSYRILAFNAIEGDDGTLVDASLEAGMARRVAHGVRERLEREATTLAVALDEARRSGEVPPQLAEAIHRIRMERLTDTPPAPRIHVRPRVVTSDSASVEGPEDDARPQDAIEFYVSVVADSTDHPKPYRTVVDWRLEETEDSSRVDLWGVVAVVDVAGDTVGEPVEVELGTLEGEAPEAELVAMEPRVEARTAGNEGGAGDEGRGEPADPAPEPPAGRTEALADLLIYDDIEVFFQPARDTTETTWEWRIARLGETDTVSVESGVFVPPDAPPSGANAYTPTERASPDDPAAFRALVGSSWMWREGGGAGPGTYVLQSCLPEPVTIFGIVQAYVGCGEGFTDDAGQEQPPRPWQHEGSFEVGAATLVLKDVIAERGTIGNDDGTGPWFALADVRLQESIGTVDAVYTWEVCPEGGSPPCPGLRREEERTRLGLRLPGELDLQSEVMGEIEATLRALNGSSRAPPTVTPGALFPAASPTRALAEPGGGATGWVHLPDQDDGGSIFATPDPVTLSGGERSYHLHNVFQAQALGPPGQPGRRLGTWLRDEAAHWFLPVEVEVAAGRRTLYAFAVYGTRPGPYTGPIPTAPGATDMVASAGGGAGDDDAQGAGGGAGAGGDAAGDRDGAGASGSGVDDDPGTDPGGPVDPAALDPNDPDISALITEWLGVARPPQAVEPDNFYVYDEWGRMVGNGADGNITLNMLPDDRGAMTSEEFVWVKFRGDLDSVDHCTLEEYVTTSLEGGSLAGCAGRYSPTPRAGDLRGRPVASARQQLEAQGHSVEVTIADWPERPEQANTVATQTPAPGARLPQGSTVRLGIYGPYQAEELAGRRVISVYGLTFNDARALLADSGFVAVSVGGSPAPSADLAFRVAAQSVSGGEVVPEGTEVRLTLFGPHRADASRGERAPPVEPIERGPSCNDLVRAANRAQARADLAGAYELYRTALDRGCTNPGLRDAMDSVYQSPECTSYIRGARHAYDRGNFQQAIRGLREAERAGCDMGPVAPMVSNTITALETGIAEQMGESCSGVASEIAEARRRGDEGLAQALSTTALVQGCSGEEVTTAMATPLPEPPQGDHDPVDGHAPPPVDVADASTSHFLGRFSISDPTRTSEEYQGTVELRQGGRYQIKEYLHGRLISSEGDWSWEPRTRTFVLDNDSPSRFEGRVSGNTNDFTISGTWSDGSSGTMRLRR